MNKRTLARSTAGCCCCPRARRAPLSEHHAIDSVRKKAKTHTRPPRCHRIGQKKPVTVIKLVSRDTVDDDIYQMQERKREMNAAIMESDSSSWAKNETKEKSAVLSSAMSRFLKSPAIARSKPSSDATSSEKENLSNVDDMII